MLNNTNIIYVSNPILIVMNIDTVMQEQFQTTVTFLGSNKSNVSVSSK